MRRNFVTRQLVRAYSSARYAEKTPAHASAESAMPLAEKKAPRDSAPIYDDTDVCRLLGLKRRVLVHARTANSRGVSWGVKGDHAGMTEAWIKSVNPSVDVGGIRPIQDGDGIATVEVKGKVANTQRLVAKKISDGSMVVVALRDSTMFHLGDQMDVKNLGGRWLYMAELNPESY